jgi:hypothetical protein
MGRLKERCGLEARTNFFSFKKVTKTRCGLDSRIYGICNRERSEHEPKVQVDGKSDTKTQKPISDIVFMLLLG